MFLHLNLAALCLALAKGQSNADIEDAGARIWAAGQSNFFSESDLTYSTSGGQLFTYVNEARFTGTYQRLLDLFDNYNMETGSAFEETCGSVCQQERSDFLNDIIVTDAMTEAREFIGTYDSSLASESAFYDYLDGIWFTLYTRSGGPLDSSGFEHVILGEIDEGDLKGYHGWEKAYRDEQAGLFEFENSLDVCDPDIPKFAMSYDGYYKPITSVFIRTPPEVELALYTICFRFRPNSGSCNVNLGGSTQPIQTYTNNCQNDYGNSCVGSAYPVC